MNPLKPPPITFSAPLLENGKPDRDAMRAAKAVAREERSAQAADLGAQASQLEELAKATEHNIAEADAAAVAARKHAQKQVQERAKERAAAKARVVQRNAEKAERNAAAAEQLTKAPKNTKRLPAAPSSD